MGTFGTRALLGVEQAWKPVLRDAHAGAARKQSCPKQGQLQAAERDPLQRPEQNAAASEA